MCVCACACARAPAQVCVGCLFLRTHDSACVRACLRACVLACVRAWGCKGACVHASACAHSRRRMISCGNSHSLADWNHKHTNTQAHKHTNTPSQSSAASNPAEIVADLRARGFATVCRTDWRAVPTLVCTWYSEYSRRAPEGYSEYSRRAVRCRHYKAL